MNDFISQLEKALTNSPSNRSVTENGAVGHKTTGKKLLDLNFSVSSLRSAGDHDVERKFSEACAEDVNTAIVWLFFARDVRGGLGERRLFRIGMTYLAREFPQKVRVLLPLISEYGRWDDLMCLLGTKARSDVLALIRDQLTQDMADMRSGKPISLLAKWMPSENTSSVETRGTASVIRNYLNITPRRYRLMLSALRKRLNVLERQMSAGQWDEIKYPAVPSRANLIYNSAFLRHDEARRREYLGKLEKGEEKINSSVLFPHDIVHQYMVSGGWSERVKNYDAAMEAMWKALPNTLSGSDASTIVVADGSGSMTNRVGKTNITALEVANALAIYFAEKLQGPYKDKYITFSMQPQLVNLAGATSLKGKLETALEHNECANTNIEAVFNLILDTAVKNNVSQQDMPRNILIISDMEFDGCASTSAGGGWRNVRPDATVFGTIAEKYARYGYQLPRLVFWNVNSRTGTIPVKENELGVALVSGFSPNVARMVMSGETDPMKALLETLNDKRYDPVREALK